MDFSGTFDTTNALSCMFLWLIFSFLAVMVNCDVQRLLKAHYMLFHMFGLLSFFFLFTLLDSNNKSSISVIWVKTFFVYVLFILMTKSKWYFVIPVLTLLLIDQSLKKDIAFKTAAGNDVQKQQAIQKVVTKWINVAIIAIIVVGSIHYGYLQYEQHKTNFSLTKLFFKNKMCR